MSHFRDAMDAFDKNELIEAVFEYGDNGYYPLELFLLRAPYEYPCNVLEELWNTAFDKACQMEDEFNDKSADLLADAAEMNFDKIKMISDMDIKTDLCSKLISDLTMAAEECGIGMKTDSEWQYLNVKDSVEKYIEDI